MAALADNLRDHEVAERIDLARLQRRWRVAHRQFVLRQIRLFHTVAAPVAVGEPVERGHGGSREPAFDDHDEARAVELRFPQIRAVGHLAVHLAAVAGPAVARLAVSLLLIEPHALAHVACVGGKRAQHASAGEQRQRSQRPRACDGVVARRE
jgi:hypothetical protein